MGDRLDEMAGQVKQGIGDLTGNEEMEREGQAQAERSKLEREAEGAIDKGVGKAQEAWGDITGDAKAQGEGIARQAEGDLKRVG